MVDWLTGIMAGGDTNNDRQLVDQVGVEQAELMIAIREAEAAGDSRAASLLERGVIAPPQRPDLREYAAFQSPYAPDGGLAMPGPDMAAGQPLRDVRRIDTIPGTPVPEDGFMQREIAQAMIDAAAAGDDRAVRALGSGMMTPDLTPPPPGADVYLPEFGAGSMAPPPPTVVTDYPSVEQFTPPSASLAEDYVMAQEVIAELQGQDQTRPGSKIRRSTRTDPPDYTPEDVARASTGRGGGEGRTDPQVDLIPFETIGSGRDKKRLPGIGLRDDDILPPAPQSDTTPREVIDPENPPDWEPDDPAAPFSPLLDPEQPFKPSNPELAPETSVAPKARTSAMNAPGGAGGAVTDGDDGKDEGDLNWVQQFAKDKLGWDAGQRQDMGRALMAAGFATMAGDSPWALQNIGEGGLAGMQAYDDSLDDRRRREREDEAAARAKAAGGRAAAGENRASANFRIKQMSDAKKLLEMGLDPALYGIDMTGVPQETIDKWREGDPRDLIPVEEYLRDRVILESQGYTEEEAARIAAGLNDIDLGLGVGG